MVKNLPKKTKKRQKNKKTRKNLGKGPSLLSIKLPPLSNQSILIENPIRNSNSRIMLPPLQTYSNIDTIYNENPILSKSVNTKLNENLLDSVSEMISSLPVSRGRSKTNKSVRINSNDNEIIEFDIDSYEKSQKRFPRNTNIKPCKKRTLKFPCRKKNTIFIDREEYDRYLELKRNKNYSTGNLSLSDHYNKIRKELETQGISLKSKKR